MDEIYRWINKEDKDKAKEEYFQNGAISARGVIWSLNGIKDFHIKTLCGLIKENKSNICIYDEMYCQSGFWRIGKEEDDRYRTISDWGEENPTAEIIGEYHECVKSTNEGRYSGVFLDKYYVVAKEDTDKLVSRLISEKYSVISLVDQYSKKVNKNNCHITNEEMKIMEVILSKALEVELNQMVKMFNNGKMSKSKFERYYSKYNFAKKSLLNMEKSWKDQEEERIKLTKEKQGKVEEKKEPLLKEKKEHESIDLK